MRLPRVLSGLRRRSGADDIAWGLIVWYNENNGLVICGSSRGIQRVTFKHRFASAVSSVAGCLAWGLWAPGKSAWQFDLLSGALGFGLGVLLLLVVYILRERIVAFRDGLVSRARHVREAFSKGVKDRYREQLVEMAENAHLLRRYAPLSEVYVEHRFVLPYADPFSNRPQPGERKDERWSQLCLHDTLHPPQVTIGLGEALQQCNRLAVLGPLGSGRTTLLAYMAQLFGRREGWRLTCDEPRETDSSELRAARNRERERLPTWIDLDTLDFALADSEERHALLDPIVSDLTASLRGIIARPSASFVRSRIIAGECLLLLDNLDQLGPRMRDRALDWLAKLTLTYPENVFVVTGLPEGYGGLWRIGFAPLMLEGFQRKQVSGFVQHWEAMRDQVELSAWDAEVEAAREAFDREVALARKQGRPPAETEFVPPDPPERPPSLLRVWKEGNQERVLPLDLALASLLWREQGDVPLTSLMRYAQLVLTAVERAEDTALTPPQWARVLSAVAWNMQVEARDQVQRAELEELVTGILVECSDLPAGDGSEEDRKEELEASCRRLARAALADLVETGDLLLDVGRGEVEFVHPTFGHYFAAQHAARNNLGERLAAHVVEPRWQNVILFYAALSRVAPLVRQRLRSADDLFRSNFFVAVGYLAVSPEVDQRLRDGILAQLAQVLLESNQPVMLRRQAAHAIAQTRDRGVLHLFEQALQHKNAHIRLLGVGGLADMEDEGLVEDLFAMLSDPAPLVRLEALYALGALGGDRALDGLVRGLQDEEELLRRVAAETLAAVGGEGHELLREAGESDDIHIRRAGVHGLGAVREPWALDLIQRIAAEDEEWYVRSAAIEALEQSQAGPPKLLPELKLTDREWLVAWGAEHNVGVETEPAAFAAIVQAIGEGDWAIKLAAAEALRICGGLEAVQPLRTLLANGEVLVREAAYIALREISRRTGLRIPLRQEE
jgi:HEAT repeat protein